MPEFSGCFCPSGLPRSLAYINQSQNTLNQHCILNHPNIYTQGNMTIAFTGELYIPEYIAPEEYLLTQWTKNNHSCLDSISGSFSFALHDPAANRLCFARDPMGVKTLFYAQRGDRFYVSTTLKGLLVFPEVEPVVDAEGLYDLMLLGPGRTPGCGIYRDVYELKPGQWGYFDETGLHLFTYWSLKDAPCTDSFPEITEKVRELVETSIGRQLHSTLPVCTFLSGGLDSSIVSAVAAREMGALDVYSLEYKENDRYFSPTRFQPTSDTDFMYLMAEHIGATTHRVEIDTEPLVNALTEAADARGLPGMGDVDSSMLLLCRAAGESPKVVLSGECADEFFGGYPWYRDPAIRSAAGFPWAQTTEYRASFLRPEVTKWMVPGEYVQEKYRQTLNSEDLMPNQDTTEVQTKQMFVLNFTWFMQTLLARNDRMSAESGVTLRAPFCDKDIAQYLYTVPWSAKDYMGREKGLLRHAFRDLLPEAIVQRKKSPFPKTWNPRYMEAVSNLLCDELSGSNSPLLEFLDRAALLKLCGENRSRPWYGQLMTTPQTIAYFLQMAHWLKTNRVQIKLA